MVYEKNFNLKVFWGKQILKLLNNSHLGQRIKMPEKSVKFFKIVADLKSSFPLCPHFQ
jgi:hypothetical protein